MKTVSALGRHRRAGENPDRLTRGQCAAGGCGRRRRDRQWPAAFRVRRRDRRGARHSRRPRNYRTAADRSARLSPFAITRPRAAASPTFSVSRDRHHAFADDPLELIDRQQRSGKSKAIVGQLRHHMRPGVSRRSGRAASPRPAARRRSFRCRRYRRPARRRLRQRAVGAIATIQSSSGCSSGLPTSAR